MSDAASDHVKTGLEVLDLESHSAFAQRRLHIRGIATQMGGMHRLAQAFVANPGSILQEMVSAAVDLCGADSVGISLEREDEDGAKFYVWVATAGAYAPFLNARLPAHPSACAICLERGKPQLFRVSQPFFELMSLEAATVTDGILLPWKVEGTRGTIWIMAHGRSEAFDREDLRVMEMLASFAAMGVRQQRQQEILMKHANAAAAAAMANDLAHQINNPLQSLTNVLYLAAEGRTVGDEKTLALKMLGDFERLSKLIKKLLASPKSDVDDGRQK